MPTSRPALTISGRQTLADCNLTFPSTTILLRMKYWGGKHPPPPSTNAEDHRFHTARPRVTLDRTLFAEIHVTVRNEDIGGKAGKAVD